MRPLNGTTELNHFYYACNSLSALHSSQQFHDDTVSTSVHPLVSTQETNGTTSSGFASGPQLSHDPISSPVLAGSIRNVTGEAMPTSLAEAVTQLSFVEFLQRCNLLIAPFQPPQLPVPISLLDVAVQTASPCDASQNASTQTSDQPVSSLSFDVAVETSFHSVHTSSLDAAVQTLPHSTLSQHVSTQMGSRPFSLDVFVQTPTRSTVLPLTEFFIGCMFSNDPFDRQRSSSAQGDIGSVSLPPLPDNATTCTLSSSSLDSDDHVRTLAPRVLLQPPPGLEQYAPPPGLDIDAHLCASHGIPVKAAPLRPRLRSAFSVTPHSLLLVRSIWEHIMRDQLLPAREVLVLFWREPAILSIQFLVQGLALFLNRVPSFVLGSTLVNPNLMGTVVLIQPTVISCIINIDCLSFSGIQARRAGSLLTLFPLPVVSIMQLFFKKPVITSHTSLSSSLCAPAIRILQSCSIKTPLSLTLKFSHTRLTPQAKVRGVWSCSSFEVSSDIHLSLDHRLLLFAQYTQCRG